MFAMRFQRSGLHHRGIVCAEYLLRVNYLVVKEQRILCFSIVFDLILQYNITEYKECTVSILVRCMMAQLHVDVMGFGEIGGVGEMSYRTVRFPEYDLRYENNVGLLCPVYTEESKVIDTNKDFYMTGQALLASLCNLYKKINDPSCDEPFTKLIADWCVKNTHPFQIDLLYEELTDEQYEYTDCSQLVMRDGIFEVNDFLHDLEALYHTTCYYYALLKLRCGDDSYANHLYYEGKLSDGYSFFEKYKNEETMIRKSDNTVIDRLELLKEMREENKTLKDLVDNNAIYHDRPFLQNPLDDYKHLQDVLLGLFPEFRMTLRRDSKTKRVMFAADVQSVFDLGWYTLSRCVADDSPKEDEDPDSMFREGSILACLNCGDYFIRRGPRQLYCDKLECQAARKRKNRRDCDARKRAEKAKEE